MSAFVVPILSLGQERPWFEERGGYTDEHTVFTTIGPPLF